MGEPPHPQIHPDVFALVEETVPSHPETRQFWTAIAAEVSDGYRPEFLHKSAYRWFLQQKIQYVVDNDWNRLRQELNDFRKKATFNFLDGKHGKFIDWLFSEVELYRRQVMAEKFLPVFEAWLKQQVAEKTSIDLTSASPAAISSALEEFLSDRPLPMVEGLANSLITYILHRFPDRSRVDPFWSHVRERIGAGFLEDLIQSPEYTALLDIQVRYYGFGEPASLIRGELLSLKDQYAHNRPAISPTAMSAVSSRLEETLEDTRRRRGSAPSRS